MNMKQSTEKENDAIDALIKNAGEEGLFVDDFMNLLSISQAKAEQLMMELHRQGKLELKWVSGSYYKK
jgi:type II secretory pathway predicted ATPase ExeA